MSNQQVEVQLEQTIEAMKRERDEGYMLLIGKLQQENDVARNRCIALEKSLARQAIKSDDISRDLETTRNKLYDLLTAEPKPAVSEEQIKDFEKELYEQNQKIDDLTKKLETLKISANQMVEIWTNALWNGRPADWDDVQVSADKLRDILLEIS